jgi:hypothetical protein
LWGGADAGDVGGPPTSSPTPASAPSRTRVPEVFSATAQGARGGPGRPAATWSAPASKLGSPERRQSSPVRCARAPEPGRNEGVLEVDEEGVETHMDPSATRSPASRSARRPPASGGPVGRGRAGRSHQALQGALPRYLRRASEPFEAITELPEYTSTRAERAILERHAGICVTAGSPTT